MGYTYDEKLLNTLETELSKADSVLTVIQQHYFNLSEIQVQNKPVLLVVDYKLHSDLLDISLDIVHNAIQILSTVQQNVKGGAAND